MINSQKTVVLQTSLAADGYKLDVTEMGERLSVTITATEQACADCLVPKDLMLGILGETLGVDPGLIDLRYPSDEER